MMDSRYVVYGTDSGVRWWCDQQAIDRRRVIHVSDRTAPHALRGLSLKSGETVTEIWTHATAPA